ncbi:MAG: hypothetical protein H0W88_05895 [Parachlamydiaceae bacterium]|nr:hypothetical protein [Parachlamydiaceae bacterium]
MNIGLNAYSENRFIHSYHTDETNSKTYDDGSVITGNFTNGNGTGCRKFTTGHVWIGEFEDYLLNGKGKHTLPDGTIFEGNFDGGKLDGEGKITYPNGKTEEGIFQQGKLIVAYW